MNSEKLRVCDAFYINSLRVYDPAADGGGPLCLLRRHLPTLWGVTLRREPKQSVSFMQKACCFISLHFRGGAEHSEAEGFNQLLRSNYNRS